MITVVGIFENEHLANEASLYLLGNGFTNENVDVHTQGEHADEDNRIGDFFGDLFEDEQRAGHFASLGRNGSIVTVHAASAREGQEAADVLNNYGAMDVNASDDSPSHSQLIERIVDDGKRLKGHYLPPASL